MVPGGSPPVALDDAVLIPIGGAAFDLALEEEPRDVARVREWHQQQIHQAGLIAGREPEAGQERYRLTALLEEDGARMHHLDVGELGGGLTHDDPPHGTCSKNRMPSLTRILAPGFSGVS